VIAWSQTLEKDALQAKVPWLAHQLKSGNSFSTASWMQGRRKLAFIAEKKAGELAAGTECD
jgi:hypothetical protein